MLLTVKDAAMTETVAELSIEECDALMKYIYRGCELPLRYHSRVRPAPRRGTPSASPPRNCRLGGHGKKHEIYQSLLRWHPAVLKRAGRACIVRTISEPNEKL